MHDLDYPQGLNTEAICSNLVRLLQEGYAVRFKPFEHAGLRLCSITVSHPDRDVCVRQAGTLEGIGDVMTHVYSRVPEAKGEVNDDAH